jgi:hypothetical protein
VRLVVSGCGVKCSEDIERRVTSVHAAVSPFCKWYGCTEFGVRCMLFVNATSLQNSDIAFKRRIIAKADSPPHRFPTTDITIYIYSVARSDMESGITTYRRYYTAIP